MTEDKDWMTATEVRKRLDYSHENTVYSRARQEGFKRKKTPDGKGTLFFAADVEKFAASRNPVMVAAGRRSRGIVAKTGKKAKRKPIVEMNLDADIGAGVQPMPQISGKIALLLVQPSQLTEVLRYL